MTKVPKEEENRVGNKQDCKVALCISCIGWLLLGAAFFMLVLASWTGGCEGMIYLMPFLGLFWTSFGAASLSCIIGVFHLYRIITGKMPFSKIAMAGILSGTLLFVIMLCMILKYFIDQANSPYG